MQIAIDLFWENGYFNSSVDEIVRQSRVAKYGIYGTFGTKHELFKKTLQQYAADRHSDIQSPIRRPDAALPEIRQFFENAVHLMTQNEARRGCLMVNTGVELGWRNNEIQAVVTQFFQETSEVMARCLNNAITRGQIVGSPDTTALAAYLITEFRTALMLASSGCSRQEIQAHLEIALKVLDK